MVTNAVVHRDVKEDHHGSLRTVTLCVENVQSSQVAIWEMNPCVVDITENVALLVQDLG